MLNQYSNTTHQMLTNENVLLTFFLQGEKHCVPGYQQCICQCPKTVVQPSEPYSVGQVTGEQRHISVNHLNEGMFLVEKY